MAPVGSISGSPGYAPTQQTALAEQSGVTRTPRSDRGAVPVDRRGISLPDDRVTLSGQLPETDQTGTPGTPPSPADQKATSGERTTTDGKSLEDPQVKQIIERLKATEEKVKAHEAAHKAAGGNLAGPASYSYTQGPDGRSYITGGEVQIDMSPGRTPQETISKMQQVIRAALAPADPSGQDRAVAAQAASQMAKAQQEKLQAESPASLSPDPVTDLTSKTDRQTGQPQSPKNRPSTGSVTDSQARQAYGNPAVSRQPSSDTAGIRNAITLPPVNPTPQAPISPALSTYA